MSADSASEFKDFEAEGFGAQAKTYGRFGQVTSRLAEPLLDAAGVRHGHRVLDVATGPGYVAERAAARGATPIGIDIAEGMIELARRNHPALEFQVADAENPPFDEASFDAVVGGFVVNHLPRPELAMTRLARLIGPGGAAAFSVWDRPERSRLIGVAFDAIAEVGVEQPAHVPSGEDPLRFADEGEFELLLAAAGLESVAVETVSLQHELTDAEEFWQTFMGASVRTKAVIEAQSEQVQAEIREAFDGLAEELRAGEVLEVPVSVKIASGRKP
jgi:SAM-dependent methyltransferase